MNATRLLTLLGALVLLGINVANGGAQEQPAKGSDPVRVVKFPWEHQPARQDVVVFKYPNSTTQGLAIERITIEGGRVEISGDRITIEGGKVEIMRQPRP